MGLTLFFVAGEHSGDLLASQLAGALLRRDSTLRLVGVGGPRMARAGVEILVETTEWGVVGYLEAYLRIPMFLLRLRRVLSLIRRVAPDLLVLVDFPGFNLQVASRLRGKVPIVYFVPPMVYGRRGDRARKIARLGMKLLATLPFDAECYARAGADVVFTGHPARDLVRPSDQPEILRASLGASPTTPVIGLLPGSRRQEVEGIFPTMLGATTLIQQAFGDVRFVAAPLPSHRSFVERVLARGPALAIWEGRPYDVMAASDLLLVTSGTAALEAACLGTPMIVVYRLSWLSWIIANREVTLKYASLPNLLLGRAVVPELLQDRLTAESLAAEAITLLQDEERRKTMRADLLQAASMLGPGGAFERAAEEVFKVLSGL
ncbi:MAG: lipid-A-disaccharide synthase [Armatimonadota bacterium]|nr:lipid-A-disaccharide synthase [Armatimonadota bacterium]MDR5702743.1 lipid-A-disaccharide synthase [Armatimonadota bacterium]